MTDSVAEASAGLEATTAFPGDALELVAEVQDAKPADRVRFAVTAPDGRVLDVLEATVDAAGLARAPWTVEPGQLALPVELTFVADCLGETRTAAALRVEPPELKAAVAWHLAADDARASDGIAVEEQGQPAPELGEVVGTQVPEGTRLVVRSEVGAGGQPVRGGIGITVTLERAPVTRPGEAGGAFVTWKQFQATTQSAAGVVAVTLVWAAEADADKAHEVRAVLAWRAGARDGGQGTSRPVTVVPQAAPGPDDPLVLDPWAVFVGTPPAGTARVDAVRLRARAGGYDEVIPRRAAQPVEGGLAYHFPEGPAGGYDVLVRAGSATLSLLKNLQLPPPPPTPMLGDPPPGPGKTLAIAVCAEEAT